MTALIVTEIADKIMTIRFNRPDKKNAITTAMYAALNDSCRAAETDPAVRVVVFTGEGNVFCSGNDVNDFKVSGGEDAPVLRFMDTLASLSKPAIAAVNGAAIGIGATLLLHCDLVYAVPGAKLQMPFVNLAIAPEFCSSMLLARYVGQRRAAEILMLGEPFTAESALADKLINGIVAPDALVETAMAKARTFAAKAPGALRTTKRLMRADLPEIKARMKLEGEELAKAYVSPELAEAVRAFNEKRAPDFSKFS